MFIPYHEVHLPSVHITTEARDVESCVELEDEFLVPVFMVGAERQQTHIVKTIQCLIKTGKTFHSFKAEMFVGKDPVLTIEHTHVVLMLWSTPEPIELYPCMLVWIAFRVEEGVVQPKPFQLED